MWSIEHSGETTATAGAVWGLWADVAGWGEWNPDIEHVELHGPFAAGSRITMTPAGQEPVELTIAEAVPGERFVDVAALGDTTIRTLHLVEPLGGGRSRITYRMEATGPDAEVLGPAISADFPETIAGLVKAAEAVEA